MRKNGWTRLATLAVAVTLGLAGCGDNTGNPVGYGPEGLPSDAVLVLHTVPTAADSSSLALVVSVLSPPPANGFRIYLNPANEGFRPASDAPIPPVITLTSGWSLYQTVVDGYRPDVSSQIQARGARDGIESSVAPLTNVGFVAAAAPIDLLRLGDAPLGLPGDSTIVSNQPTLNWQVVPGAMRYILQVTDAGANVLYSAVTTTNSHQVGVGPGIIVQEIPFHHAGLYRWSVQAFDAGSRLIAVTRTSRAFFVSIPPTP